MNKPETLKILSILRLAYPGRYKGYNDDDYDDMALLWSDMFPDEPFEQVGAALKALIATDEKGFPPSIGAVKGMIVNMRGEPEMTGTEAWHIARGAMTGCTTREEYLQLPDAIRRAIGGMSQLRQWGMTDQKELPRIMEVFLRSYRTALEQQRTRALIPMDIQAVMRGGIAAELPEKRAPEPELAGEQRAIPFVLPDGLIKTIPGEKDD